MGISVGTVYCGSPTCADDLMLLANRPSDLQCMMDLVLGYSRKERYRIHPTKSQIVTYNSEDTEGWTLGENPVPESTSLAHLGIVRHTDNLSPNTLISERILVARRTTYALMGTGFHGTNGLPPKVSLKIYSTYVIPRLLFGLESLVVNKTQLQMLEVFHKKTLRCIQGLPERVASSAIYLLIGEIPIAAKLHIKISSLLQMIANDPESALHKVALRQCASKDSKSKSWFIYAEAALALYGLPKLQDILISKPKRGPWKFYTTEVISAYWTDHLKDEAVNKSTLNYLNLDACNYGSVHPVWQDIFHPEEVKRAMLRAKLLCGVYMLQSNKARFNQYKVKPDCPLCGQQAETREHFLMICSALGPSRVSLLQALYSMIPALTIEQVIDSSRIRPDRRVPAEIICRKLIYKLHEARAKQLLSLTQK